MEFDFKKNATVADLSAVPEQYRPLYEPVPDGEGHRISDAAKPIVEAYAGVSQSLAAANAELKRVREESAGRRVATRGYDELMEHLDLEADRRNPEGLREFVDGLVSKVKGGEELKINLDKIRREADQRVADTAGAKDKEIAAKDAALARHLIGDVATRAIADAKGSVDLLMPHVRAHCVVVQDGDDYVVRVRDQQGDHRPDGKGGWMGVSDLVAEMKQNPTFGRAFESEAPRGGGTPPGATRVATKPPAEDKSSTQKIADGLAKRQRAAMAAGA